MKKLISGTLIILALCGCRSTQLPIESKVVLDPRSGLINLALPKNSSGKELRYDQKVGTNTLSLLLKDFSFTNSPLVLDAAGAANVAAINAWGGVIKSLMDSAIALSGKTMMVATPQPLMELTPAPSFQYHLLPPPSFTVTNIPALTLTNSQTTK